MKTSPQRKESTKLKKLLVGIVGGWVLLIGVIAIPYPGPGWLIVFAGLAILAREFHWAHRLLLFAKKNYNNWNLWIRKQSIGVQTLSFMFTAVVVVATLWLFNAYGLLADFLNIDVDWLNSPL